MITAAITNTMYWFITQVIKLLPSVENLPNEFQLAIAFIRQVISGFLDIFPASSAFVDVIFWLIVFEMGMFAWWAMNWVINKIRGLG